MPTKITHMVIKEFNDCWQECRVFCVSCGGLIRSGAAGLNRGAPFGGWQAALWREEVRPESIKNREEKRHTSKFDLLLYLLRGQINDGDLVFAAVGDVKQLAGF